MANTIVSFLQNQANQTRQKQYGQATTEATDCPPLLVICGRWRWNSSDSPTGYPPTTCDHVLQDFNQAAAAKCNTGAQGMNTDHQIPCGAITHVLTCNRNLSGWRDPVMTITTNWSNTPERTFAAVAALGGAWPMPR